MLGFGKMIKQRTVILFALLLMLSACFSKKEKDMTAKEPITGYEKTIKFIVGDVKLDVPYGYLFEYSRKRGKIWLTEEKERHRMEGLSIMVAEREQLAPYSKNTKHHFFNYVDGTGSDAVSILIRPKERCNLNIPDSIKSDLSRGYYEIPISNQHYIAYEAKNLGVASPYDAFFYRNDDTEKIVINLSKENPGYSVRVFSCYRDLYVHYYLDYHDANPPSSESLILINEKIQSLKRFNH